MTRKLPKKYFSCHFDQQVSKGSRMDCSVLALTEAFFIHVKCDSHNTEVLALFIYHLFTRKNRKSIEVTNLYF